MNDNDTKNLVLVGRTWYLRACIHGATVKQSLRTGNLELARQRRDERLGMFNASLEEKKLLQSIRRQLSGLEQEEEENKRRPDGGLLLSGMMDVFLSDPDRHHVIPAREKRYGTVFARFSSWLEGKYPQVKFMRQVTKSIARDFARDMLRECNTTATYNNILSTIRYIFKIVGEYDDYYINPWSMSSKPVTDNARRDVFTAAELGRIFASEDAEFVRLMAVGLYTALRLDNARKTKWEDISVRKDSDGEMAWYFAKLVHTKTNADGSIRLPWQLREILERVPEGERHGYICPDYAGNEKCWCIKRIKARLDALGIETQQTVTCANGKTRLAPLKSFHSLRHTAVTIALERGASIAAVKRLAGHASEEMQEHYSHLSADIAGDTAELIGKY